MQRIEFANKIQKINQKTEQISEVENIREVKGASLSRNVVRIVGSDTFYCQSESTDIYYFIRYEPSFQWCSCLDNSTRHIKCKHIFAIEYAIRKGTLKDIEHLTKEAQRYPQVITAKSSYEEDDYDF
jgi:hypothetical protein